MLFASSLYSSTFCYESRYTCTGNPREKSQVVYFRRGSPCTSSHRTVLSALGTLTDMGVVLSGPALSALDKGTRSRKQLAENRMPLQNED